jgi:hypothetical protein
MGVSADVSFDNDLDIGSVGWVGPVRVRTDPGVPFAVDVTLPQPLHAAVDNIGPVGPVTVAGIPDKFTFDIDIKNIPKILIGLDPLTINPITVNPVDLNLRLKEIPSVRAHLPADFNLGISLLGLELVCFKLCGEAQIITEPYVANPCEHCGPSRSQDQQIAPGILGKSTDAFAATLNNPPQDREAP